MKHTTVVTDFKDLKKAIEEVTKKNPAKSRYKQQAEKMGYTKDPKVVTERFKPYMNKDYPRIVDFYIQFRGGKGDRITSPDNKKDYEKALKLTQAFMRKNKITSKLETGTPEQGSSAYKISLILNNKKPEFRVDLRPLVDQIAKLKTAEDHGGGYDKPLKEETISENYRKLAVKGMGTETPRTAKVGLELDYYSLKDGSKRMGKIVKKTPTLGYQIKDDEDGSIHTFLYHDREYGKILLKQSNEFGQEPLKGFPANEAVKESFDEGLKEENLQEGTWAVPDSYKKLYNLQVGFLQMPSKPNPNNAKRMAKNIYSIFGDDSFFDDLLRVEKGMEGAETDDLRNLIVKHLEPWGLKFKKGAKYQITHAPQKWIDNMTANPADESVDETAKKRKPGNLKPTGLGRSMKVTLKASMCPGTKEDKLDPVGKADADIDNDGDVDSSDKYLKKRRAAISKAMKEDSELEKKPASELTPREKDELRRKKMRDAERARNVANMKRAQDKAQSDKEQERRKKERERNLKMVADKDRETFRDRQKRLGKSQTEQLQDAKETAQRSPFKLKSQAYPKALGIETEGFGVRHATREDIVEACDSFGMITEQELQLEQLQKTLGKKGFLTYNISELNDVFDERETERVILALESVTTDETLEPIDYTRAQIDEALETELEIEFVKPDGMKAVGPILKMCENTYNVKDKHTGKSFTFKYEDEGDMKTFRQITEAKFPKKLVRMAGGIAFDKRYVGGNMTGAVKAIEKIKKGLSDDPEVKRMLRLANESFNNEFYKALSEKEKTEYQKFFQSVLKKFGVKSPAELSGDKEKEFYNYVDKNWSGKTETDEWISQDGARRRVKEGDKRKTKEEELNPSKTKIDGRRTNFREKMRKLGYIKAK